MFTESRTAWGKAALNVSRARPLWNMSGAVDAFRVVLSTLFTVCPRALCYGAWLQALLVTQQELCWDPQLGNGSQDWSPGLSHHLESKQSCLGTQEMGGADGEHRAQVPLLPYTPHPSRGGVKSQVYAQSVMRKLKQEGNPGVFPTRTSARETRICFLLFI